MHRIKKIIFCNLLAPVLVVAFGEDGVEISKLLVFVSIYQAIMLAKEFGVWDWIRNSLWSWIVRHW